MVVKLFFVLRYFFIGNGDINILLGELVAWTIILVSPICDALIEKELKKWRNLGVWLILETSQAYNMKVS